MFWKCCAVSSGSCHIVPDFQEVRMAIHRQFAPRITCPTTYEPQSGALGYEGAKGGSTSGHTWPGCRAWLCAGVGVLRLVPSDMVVCWRGHTCTNKVKKK